MEAQERGGRARSLRSAPAEHQEILLQTGLRLLITAAALVGLWLSGLAAGARLTVTLVVLLGYWPATLAMGRARARTDRVSLSLGMSALDLGSGLAGALLVPDVRTAVLLLYLVLIVVETISEGPGRGLVVAAGTVIAGAVAELATASTPTSRLLLVTFVGSAAALPLLLGQVRAERRRLTRQLARLQGALAGIERGPDLEATLKGLAESARDVLRATSTVVVVDSDEDPRRVVASDPTSGVPDTSDAELQARSTRRPVEVAEPKGDRGSVVVVPIVSGTEVLGTIGAHVGGTRRLRPEDVALLQAYGQAAALSILRAQAFERQTLATEELRRAEQSKSGFLAGITHELRSPLTSIKGFIDTILIHRDRLPTEDVDRMLLVARRNADELAHRITVLLEFSRLEGEPVALAPSASPLRPLLATALEETGGILVEHEVRLEADEGLVVNVDEIALGHIMGNLASNAAKYAPAGTPIVVRGTRDGDQARVSVSDRGPGVDRRDTERIFERFVRGERQPPGVRGTGIGLAVVRAYVERSGGRVWVEDHPGGGASFVFTLPLADAETAP